MRNAGSLALNPVRLAALLPAVIATCWVVFAYWDLDYEVNMTKHYNKRDALYGGYGLALYECAEGYKLQHWEAETNARNATLVTETARAPRFLGFYDGGGRLLCGSFLPSLVWRLSFGHGDITLIYRVTGILLYLLTTAAAFALARVYFQSYYAGCAAAFVSTLYPLHWVCFNQIKVQEGFVLLLLVELLLVELLLRGNCRGSVKFVVLTCAIFLGGFATPANYMLGAALLIRLVFTLAAKSQRASSLKLLVPLAAFVAATVLVSEFRESHGFTLKFWDVEGQIRATRESLSRFLHSYDWGDVRIMKYSVEQFVSFLKIVGGGVWKTNPVLVVLFLVLPLVCRRPLWLWASVFPILALGHGMSFITGWFFHYGYMGGAAFMLAIILVAGRIGSAMEAGWASRKWSRAALAAAALVAVSLSFARPNDLYVGNVGWYDTDRHVYAIHGNHVKKIF